MKWEVKQFGEEALLINFEQRISPEINSIVNRVNNILTHRYSNAVTFSIPAYCSLTVGYDKAITEYDEIEEIVLKALREHTVQSSVKSGRIIEIPVCYEVPYAMDIDRIVQVTGLPPKKIIEEHSRQTYMVYMLGYVAGFGYMGQVSEILECPRLDNPRTRVPAGSVGIAGLQTGIYPMDAPGGWNIIGRTPVPIIDPNNDPPFLYNPGDTVRFYPVSRDEFEEYEV